MTEITLRSAAGADNGAELAQVLTQYASDFFDSYTYNATDREVICKNAGDNTVWVRIRCNDSMTVKTTFFNGWYAESSSSSVNRVNTVYVFENCIILCYKLNSFMQIIPICFFCKNNLGEVCCFFYSTYTSTTYYQICDPTASSSSSDPSVISLINISRRSTISIPVGDMCSHTQIVNAIPIYDSIETKLDGVYFNTMGALKDMYEATQFQCNGNTYYSVIVGRFIVEDA